MVKVALDVAKGLEKLVPPDEGAPQKEQRQWKILIAAGTVANAVALTAHIALACGLTPWWPGFAHAEDVEKIFFEKKQARINELTSQIPAMIKKWCDAPNGDLKAIFGERMTLLQEEYTDLKGRQFPYMTCDIARTL